MKYYELWRGIGYDMKRRHFVIIVIKYEIKRRMTPWDMKSYSSQLMKCIMRCWESYDCFTTPTLVLIPCLHCALEFLQSILYFVYFFCLRYLHYSFLHYRCLISPVRLGLVLDFWMFHTNLDNLGFLYFTFNV